MKPWSIRSTMIVPLFAALSMTHAVPVFAQASAPPAQVTASSSVNASPEVQALARELAGILQSEELNIAQTEAGYRGATRAVMANNPQVIAMERAYPGFTDFAIGEDRAYTLAHVRQRIPAIQASVADLFAAHCSAEELRTIVAFYRGPIGKKALLAAQNNADFSEAAKRNMAGQNPTVADQRSAYTAATDAFMTSMTDQEIRTLMAFMQSAAGAKLESLQPAMMQRVVDVASMTEAERAAIQQDMRAKVQAFIKNHPNSR